MTTEHPITPPTELVRQWHKDYLHLKVTNVGGHEYIATQAARWGADQELEACCGWVDSQSLHLDSRYLRADRRPEPPSLAAKALDAAEDMSDCMNDGFVPNRSSLDTIRRALERLKELEQQENNDN